MSGEGFKIYLVFKNKATAEKWLKDHAVKAGFDEKQLINIEVKYKCETLKESKSTA